jgi:hypothetical protein
MTFRSAAALLLCAALPAGAADTAIRVDVKGPTQPVTRTMTGACLEDVNHEVYGGIASQMLFGESFQEPAARPPLQAATQFGGSWTIDGGVLSAQSTCPGPRLVSGAEPLASGRAGVDVRFTTAGGGNAALLIAVGARGEVAADGFDGYEIGLHPGGGLTIGRHHHDYHALAEVPCPVAIGAWVHLEARFSDHDFAVFVDGTRRFAFTDPAPLAAGTVGLRVWDHAAEFRDWWRDGGSGAQELPLAYASGPAAWLLTGVSGMWRGVASGSALGSFAEVDQAPFAGVRSQRIALSSGVGAVGLENRGLHRTGLFLRAGKPYEGFVYLRSTGPSPEVSVALQDGGGTRTVAEARLVAATPATAAAAWKRYDFTLTPDSDVHAGRFAILLHQPGSVDVGYAFLQPGAWGRFKGLPVRGDVVQGLLDQGVTVLRYGGSMVNDPGYRWKNMTGPREARPPSHGLWYEYSSNGWAIPDFLALCEAMQVTAIPAINCNEDPRDVVDLIEYANGPADSPGGRRRAADGHPQPYGLRHLEIGNEEVVDAAYVAKFTAIAQAVWALDQAPTLVVGDFTYGDPVVDPFKLTNAAGAPTLAGQQQILALAKAHDREVWFDVHVWTQAPRDRRAIEVLPTVLTALTRLADGARFKVAVFELNANTHDVARAVSNACAIGRYLRLGGQVPVVCSANSLQVDGANDNGWDQGLLFLDAEKTWTQPPYHVARMVAQNWLPLTVPVESGDPDLDVTALVSGDRRVLQLNVVNLATARPVTATVNTPDFMPHAPTATVTTLSGPGGGVNTAEQPERVKPVVSTWTHELGGGAASYTFPPLSFTVIRFE